VYVRLGAEQIRAVFVTTVTEEEVELGSEAALHGGLEEEAAEEGLLELVESVRGAADALEDLVVLDVRQAGNVERGVGASQDGGEVRGRGRAQRAAMEMS